MQKDPQNFVEHILLEIEVIKSIAARYSFEDFSRDPIAYRAVVYSIQTISEAVRQLPALWLAGYPEVPWQDIRSIGNKTRHEYYRLDEAILWNVATTELGPLEDVMLDMRKRHSS